MLSGMPLFVLLIAGSPADPTRAPILTTEQIVSRMLELDEARRASLQGYTSVRRYFLENRRFHKRAEMTVRMTFTPPGTKTFEVMSEEGSKFIRKNVLHKIIAAEVEAAKDENGNRSRIIPGNYEFEMLGMEPVLERPSYVIQITPRTSNRFLIRGRIWVDAEEFAIVRLEGSPAKNPSFWTRKVQLKQQYEKHGQFWLPHTNFSRSEVRIAGPTELSIDYLEYRIYDDPQGFGANK